MVIWRGAPDLVVSIHWGTLDERAVLEIRALVDAVPADLPARGRALIDCSAVERVDPDALLLLTEVLGARLPRWSPRIERHAVVVPDGVTGILLAGALAALAPEHPVRFVRDLEAAFAFVDHPAARAAHAAAEVDAVQAGRRSELLDRVRARMERDLEEVTIDRCARELGLSPRTLQRELRRRGTSFRDELRAARVTVAAALVASSDLKITAIAARVGFGTSARLGIALRRELQLSATELRRRGEAGLARSVMRVSRP